jgi:predicted dehydrogenase
MGQGDLGGFLGKGEVQVVGVCDVDRNHREKAKQMVDRRYQNGDCKATLDFRELIGRGDLDAVMTALPDHWHAIPAVAAAEAGLDIHGQKPFARSIREGRAICNAVHRYGPGSVGPASSSGTGGSGRSSTSRSACPMGGRTTVSLR